MNAITSCLQTYWPSSIGKKFVVALSGLFLILFLAGHLAGNLVVFLGPEPFNAYAYFLHHMGHGAHFICHILFARQTVVDLAQDAC